MKEMLFVIPVIMNSLGYAIVAYVISYFFVILVGILSIDRKDNEAVDIVVSITNSVAKLIAIGVFLIKLGSK